MRGSCDILSYNKVLHLQSKKNEYSLIYGRGVQLLRSLNNQMQSIFNDGIKVMQDHEEQIIEEWENILFHFRTSKGRASTELNEAIVYLKSLVFETSLEPESNRDSTTLKQSFLSSQEFTGSLDIYQSSLILLENMVHSVIQSDNEQSQKQHQAVKYVFNKIGTELLTQPYQDFTIESFLQDLVSSKQFSVEWAALIHQNKDGFIVSKLVNKKDNSNDNKKMKANSIFELTEILLEEKETTDRKKYQVLPISYEEATLLFFVNQEDAADFIPFITYVLKTFQQGYDALAQSRQEQDWKDSVILFNEMVMRSTTYQDAAENITKGFVDYLPFERSALFSYSLQDTAGIGVHGQGLDNDIIQNIAENVNNLPIIQKNLNFLKLYGKNMKYFQPIYIKDASAGFPEEYVQLFQLGSLVVAPIFTTIEKKLLGAVLLDQGPGVYFELSQETITAISRFGQSAGEILSKFSAASEKKISDDASALSPREIEVLKLMEKGASTHEAASALHLSEYTVRDYVSTIMQKLGAQNRTEAVAKVIRNNII